MQKLELEAAHSGVTTINTKVVIDWRLSSYFAWGLNGLHFMLNWSLQQRELMLTSVPVQESDINFNPLEWACIRPALEGSRELQARLEAFRGQHLSINLPVLHALNLDFIPARGRLDVQLSGTPSIGLPVFESSALTAEVRERSKAYALIFSISRWNQSLLEEAGIGPTALVHEGIDPTAFHPAPKAGLFSDRFAIFSGGKLEYRKGQDLVLKAFRVFAQRHPEALLVTAWASPWPDIAQTLNADPTLAPIASLPDGKLDILAWAAANGIAPGQFMDLGAQPNNLMPRLYREMDVGLFPNRCEGGTNLVAMECMACGVPVILSRNTGHLDLIAGDRCFVLEQQLPLDGADRQGWGESSVEEIIETLEAVHRDRAASRTRAERGAQFMTDRTWSNTVRRRAEAIAAYL